MSIGTAGHIALLVFDATAGQRMSVAFSAGTFGTCGLNATLYDPHGMTVASAGCVGGSGFMDTATATSSGTYELLLAAQGTATGSSTVQLYKVPADAGGPITAGGSAVTVTTGTPGQNAALTFAGSAGQRVFVNFTADSYACCPGVKLLKPDGST